MPLETKAEKITLVNRGNGDSIQLLTEGDMIVPDVNPDIYQILKADEDVIIDKVKAENGRISFSGRLIVSVLYYGKKTERPLSSMRSEFTIEDYIALEGVSESSDVDAAAEIIHTDYRLVNDRKINVKAVTAVKASWTDSSTVEAVSAVSGGEGLQSKTGTISYCDVKERTAEEFTVREEFKLPAGKPDIAEILEATAEICHREVRVNDGMAFLKGDFKINIIYISTGEKFETDSAEFSLPFNGTVDVPSYGEDMFCMARMKPVKVKAEAEADSNGEPRAIEMEITVAAVLKTFVRESNTILEDAYSLSSKLDIARQNAAYIELYGRNRAQGTFRGNAVVENGGPGIMQIVKVWGSIRNGRTVVNDSIITAEGTADIKVMYIAKDDTEPLRVMETAVPFSQGIEIKGAEEGMTFDVITEIEDISFSMLSEKEAEIRLTISFDAAACENKTCGIIVDITETEADESAAFKGGAVIYTVKKGDTLWDIAKKYHTTVDGIVKLNKEKIDNPDLIYPGQRFL
ncbi:MAG: DUF3794 domain-containing protein, partial [Clostridiales bacterium]|nr:DUF3794 domain-containing protein [Clostridiales bacterium]